MSLIEKQCFVCKSKSIEDLKICGNCQSFWYCSRDHQLQDWKRHKYAECIYLSENRDLKKEIKMNKDKYDRNMKYLKLKLEIFKVLNRNSFERGRTLIYFMIYF